MKLHIQNLKYLKYMKELLIEKSNKMAKVCGMYTLCGRLPEINMRLNLHLNRRSHSLEEEWIGTE